MAKMFYSPTEAAAKLGVSEDDLKNWVRDGRLREFRDAGKVNYKVDEVDRLSRGAPSSINLGSASGELLLEPAEGSGSSIALTPGGSDVLSLAEAELDDTSAGTAAGKSKSKGDTVVTSVGISVFEDEEGAEHVDPKAKTAMAKGDEGVVLEGVGSGSGLLDLTRESDDTSLGAELLDEIYPGEEEAPAVQMGDATRAGLEEAIPETRAEAGEIFEEAAPAAKAGRGVVVTRVEYAADPLSTGLSAMMGVAVLIMLVGGLAVASMTRGVWPAILDGMYTNLWMYLAGGFGVAIIALIIGMVVGKRSAA